MEKGKEVNRLLLSYLGRDGGLMILNRTDFVLLAISVTDVGSNDLRPVCAGQNVHNSGGSLAIPVFRHAGAGFPS